MTLAELYDEVEFMEMWCKAVRKRIYDDLHRGVEIPGLKLVQGREGNRRWSVDEAQLIDIIKKHNIEGVLVETVLSPTQAEKALKKKEGWEHLDKLVERPAGKPVIAREGDKREAISAADVFDNLD